MKLSTTSLSLAGACALAGTASAQVLTELRISTAGLDHEYAEIRGIPGQSTDGLMILVVEGDPGGATGGGGTLDFAYDLSNGMFSNEYYTFGSAEAATNFPGLIDDSSAGDNIFENSSATFYLCNVPDATKRQDIQQSWAGTDITDPPGSMTTMIATDPAVTILDVVALWDGDTGDLFYDAAPVFGPDGPFLPSGIIRNGGCPGDWCTDWFIDFGTSGGATAPYVDPTPKAQNPSTPCMTTPSVGDCGFSGSIGTPYCMANPNSTGNTGELSATGTPLVVDNDVTLTASSLPNQAFGFFLVSRDAGFVANPGGSSGNLCLAGSIGRYVGPGQIQNTGINGSFSLMIDLTTVPQPMGSVVVVAGETWRFQAWHRDSAGGSATSNFTNGLEIDFL